MTKELADERGDAVERCTVGSCQRHQKCMYSPCRAQPSPISDVERVRNAIWHEDYYDSKLCSHGGDGQSCVYCEPHDDDTPDDWPADKERAERQARAAIAAMREHDETLRELVEAATALIADVRRRYPNEELRCEFMRALDEAAAKASGTIE